MQIQVSKVELNSRAGNYEYDGMEWNSEHSWFCSPGMELRVQDGGGGTQYNINLLCNLYRNYLIV